MKRVFAWQGVAGLVAWVIATHPEIFSPRTDFFFQALASLLPGSFRFALLRGIVVAILPFPA